MLAQDRPCEAVLKNEDGVLYRTGLCKPSLVTIEESGPIRAVIRSRGRFLNDNGKGLLEDKVQYDLRVTAFAGKPFVKLAFTFENNGYYGYKGEIRKGIKRQWIHLKSLRLDFPLPPAAPAAQRYVTFKDGAYPLSDKTPLTMIQRVMRPGFDLGIRNFQSPEERLEEKEIGLTGRSALYYKIKQNAKLLAHGERAEGWATM